MRPPVGVVLVLVLLVGACGGDDADSPDATGEQRSDAALAGDDRVALVSEWAHERNLLTAEEVLAALGESTAEVVNARSSDVAIDEDLWEVGFGDPFPAEEVAMDVGAEYVVRRQGDARDVITFVSEFVAHGTALAEAYANMEMGEIQRNTADERYDPVPLGTDAFAYETDGGSGALDRLVVVNTDDALVVIVASPGSPNAPEPDLTANENLTRSQVDNLVRAAVEKLG